MKEEHEEQSEKISSLTEENARDKLVNTVCDRFMFENLVECPDTQTEGQPYDTIMRFRKQKSVLLQIAAKVKGKN